MWKSYLTVFKAKAPVHIGYKQIGILKTTRYYITGRAMWGAITANLTRALFDNPDAENYQEAGEFVKDLIRTTYFFPAIEKNEVKKPDGWSKVEVSNYLVFLPEYKEEGLKFGNISKEEFEQTFIGSFVSTALESETKTAEEGSLHEFEFVRNKVRVNGDIADVYWIGYLFVKEGGGKNGFKIESCNDDDVIISYRGRQAKLSQILETTYAGGERNYGLGMLKLQNLTVTEKLFGTFNVELDKENPVIETSVAVDHLVLNSNGNSIESVLGKVEPLVGREHSEKGAGQKVSEPAVCFTPGTVLGEEKLNLEIRDFGLLYLLTEK